MPRVFKICNRCGKKRLANKVNFVVNNSRPDGLIPLCRECKQASDRIYSRKYREEHPVWQKESNKRHSKIMNKLVKEYAKKYPERVRAINAVHRALKKGKLVKEPCVVCGKEFVHAHHPDYDFPLQVVFLCPKHHKSLHSNLLTEDEKQKVYEVSKAFTSY